jgi:NAD+ diphosphatase
MIASSSYCLLTLANIRHFHSSGSPINRVSFLRSDNTFLTQAFTHPSTRFLLFNNLAPLGPHLNNLSYLKRDDISTLIPSNPWGKTEKEIMEEYNSNITIPQMVFLGLDERTHKAETERKGGEDSDDGGFKWKEVYKGAPLFAVDVTPKGSIKDKCEELIKEVTDKGLEFLQGNRNMILSFPAAEGG